MFITRVYPPEAFYTRVDTLYPLLPSWIRDGRWRTPCSPKRKAQHQQRTFCLSCLSLSSVHSLSWASPLVLPPAWRQACSPPETLPPSSLTLMPSPQSPPVPTSQSHYPYRSALPQGPVPKPGPLPTALSRLAVAMATPEDAQHPPTARAEEGGAAGQSQFKMIRDLLYYI